MVSRCVLYDAGQFEKYVGNRDSEKNYNSIISLYKALFLSPDQ